MTGNNRSQWQMRKSNATSAHNFISRTIYSYFSYSPSPSSSASTHQMWECPRGLCRSHWDLGLWWQGSPVKDNEKMRGGTPPLVVRGKHRTHGVHVPYLLVQQLRSVGLTMLSSLWTQRRVRVGFSTCSVNIGCVLQNYRRTAVGTEKKNFYGELHVCLNRNLSILCN